MANTGDIHVGSVIRFNGELVQLIEYQHRTPGNLRAFFQAKMRNLKTGKLAEYRFRAGEEVEIARVEYKELQYIYKEGEHFVCMDNDTYEQVHIPLMMFGDSGRFLKEGMEVKITFEGDDPILAEAPTFIEAQITYTEPGLKGDTATNTLKNATIDTGTEIRVPLFFNEGDWVKIDTRTGDYVERIKK